MARYQQVCGGHRGVAEEQAHQDLVAHHRKGPTRQVLPEERPNVSEDRDVCDRVKPIGQKAFPAEEVARPAQHDRAVHADVDPEVGGLGVEDPPRGDQGVVAHVAGGLEPNLKQDSQ